MNDRRLAVWLIAILEGSRQARLAIVELLTRLGLGVSKRAGTAGGDPDYIIQRNIHIRAGLDEC
jgi:hypothetical protein